MTWRGSGPGHSNTRGRGRGRGTGRERNNRDGREQATGICRDFVNGDCKRRNCRFSHDVDGANNGTQRQVRAEETEKQKQARTQYNGWKKYLGQAYSPSDPYNMQRVWKGALDILHEDDRDWKQQLPRDLDDDEYKCNGRAHVKALFERQATSGDKAEFIEVSKNFLEVITHPSLINCLAVDEYVSGIYSFIGGGNGTRAFRFFQHVCEILVTIYTDGHPSVSQNTVERALTRLAAALYELLYRNRRARLHDDLDELINTIDNAAEIIPASQPSVTTTIVKRCIADTRALVGRAKGLVADEESVEDVPRTFAASLYPRDIVVPTDRHDNDKLDIAEITIFPTRDELMSDAKEFLPSTDPDQPHFLPNKIERHIDTNFRLYRHDVFGELKKALSGLLRAAADDPVILSKSKAHLGDVRAHHYSNAHVSYVSFDVRRGLQAQISFPQLSGARHRSVEQRRAWWEDSRRLEEGSLLSYIFFQGSAVQHLFFTVTQRSTNPAQEYGLVDLLKQSIERTIQMLCREFYEDVTKEEIEAIKRAMLSSRGGIATHSGHWYNCVNGHPVSVHRQIVRVSTNRHSLLLASVVCQCNLLVARNAVNQSVARTIKRLQESLVQLTWMVELKQCDVCKSLKINLIALVAVFNGRYYIGGRAYT
mgnify:CR=1 FL=1